MRTTVTLGDELAAHVDDVRASPDESDAAAVRACVERSQRLGECRDRVAELERGLERARRERRQLLEQREEHSELVRAVERERSIQERKTQAGLATRVKWAIFGMDDGSD
jgi:hypothetical protein